LVAESAFGVPSDAIRSIDVPFHVKAGTPIEIGSITETHEFEINPGSYNLRCVIGPSDIYLVFDPVD
jgi:hypothetical protein